MARADHLFKKLKAARLDNTTEAEHRRLAAVTMLIIDDFALQPLDDTATADFCEMITGGSPDKAPPTHPYVGLVREQN